MSPSRRERVGAATVTEDPVSKIHRVFIPAMTPSVKISPNCLYPGGAAIAEYPVDVTDVETPLNSKINSTVTTTIENGVIRVFGSMIEDFHSTEVLA